MSSNKPHYDADPEEIVKKENDCWTFNPRGFSIVWGSDKRYWNLPEKRTDQREEAAELVQVCWLEVTGTTKDSLPPGKSYEIKFQLSMKQGAFGWNNCPVYMMAKVGKRGRYKWNKINLSDQNLQNNNGFIETKIEIKVEESAVDSKLYFGLYEVWTGKWKGGLLIHKATVEPVKA